MFVKYLTLRWRYFWRKSNQNVGVATPPHPNAAQCVETLVCYKSVKITNLTHYIRSHCNFSSIFASISPPASLHCVWLTLALCLLSAATAINTRGNSFSEPLSVGAGTEPRPYDCIRATVVWLYNGRRNASPTDASEYQFCVYAILHRQSLFRMTRVGDGVPDIP